MIDPDWLKVIAGIVTAAYPTIVKIINGRLESKRSELRKARLADAHTKWSEIRKRLVEFDEIIHLPDDLREVLPPELIEIIEERNHFRLMSEHYRERVAQLEGLNPHDGSIKEIIQTVNESAAFDLFRSARNHSQQLGSNTDVNPSQSSDTMVQSSPDIQVSRHDHLLRDNNVEPITSSEEVGSTGSGPNSHQSELEINKT